MPTVRALLLVLLVAIACPCFAEEPKPEYTIDDFVTTYWFGPPAEFNTFERYQEIKNANFTVALPIWVGRGVERNRAILDYCQKLGMKAIIYDERMTTSIDGRDDVKRNLDAMVKDYADHPALLAYSIADEPPADKFDGLADVVAHLKEKDPKHPGYINLLPTWARQIPGPEGSKHSYLGTATYEDYVREFVKKVKPAWLCYDNYGMLKYGDRGDFHENLFTIRKVARESNLPFWNIVLVTQHGDFRVLTEPELRFEAMQTIAFGAKGVVWFTYWSPQGHDTGTTWTHAMINEDGSRDAHYDMVKAINADLLAMGREIKNARHVSIAQHGGGKGEQYSDGESPIDVEAGKVSVGGFVDEKAGKSFAILANIDYKAATAAKFRIKSSPKQIEQFDSSTRKWNRMPAGDLKQLDLPAGAGVLIRW